MIRGINKGGVYEMDLEEVRKETYAIEIEKAGVNKNDFTLSMQHFQDMSNKYRSLHILNCEAAKSSPDHVPGKLLTRFVPNLAWIVLRTIETESSRGILIF